MLTAGSTWSMTLETEDDRFPPGVALYGEVRRQVSDASPAMRMSSLPDPAMGLITRSGLREIVLTFPGALTADWNAGEVFVDLWRTDTADPVIITPTIGIPVVKPITRRPVTP